MTNQNAVQKYAVAGVADVLSCFGIPTGVATQLYQDILEKRNAEALEILLSEIRQGNFENIDQQDVISILARYQRDAMEGVARNNLRLMARVINGMAEKKELTAPSFLKYANVLASLTEDEIAVLAVMIKHRDYYPNSESMVHEDIRHDALIAVTPHAESYMQALIRTGLVRMVTDKIDYNQNTTNNYRITKLMDEILRFADFFPKAEAA